MNHHQMPLSLELLRLTNNNYFFIATTPTPEERIDLGYTDYSNQYPWIVKTYESEFSEKRAIELCEEADLVICGLGMGSEKYIQSRTDNNKITFYYSERVFKQGFIGTISGKGITVPWPNFVNFKYNKQNWIWKGYKNIQKYPNVYMLCASNYTAGDFALARMFKNRCYKWGYFPDVIKYDNLNELFDSKKRNSILWAGRLIDLKHPEYAIRLAKRLKNDGMNFSISLIGDGSLRDTLEGMIESYDVKDCVHLLGAMDHERVRQYMENAEIYLFTSNYEEGWGAVLNESMNSGCAVVVSDAIGSAGFLINDHENGLLFQNENENDLYKKVKSLLDNSNECRRLGLNAYHTLLNEWNPRTAAERILQLSECLANGQETPFKEGPCSRAEVIIRGKLFHK